MTPNAYRRFLPAVPVVLVALAVVSRAQTPEAPSFEVASIKRMPSSDVGIFTNIAGETFTARNITVRQLLLWSYAERYLSSEVIGGPGWIDVDRFAIIAKMGRPDAPVLRMVRSLLIERFNLRMHEEARERPVFHLVLARPDGRLGPGLRPSTIDCQAAARRPPGDGERCGWRSMPGLFVGKGVSIPLLVSQLSYPAQRRIVDKTILAGQFDIDLTWESDGPGAGAPVGPEFAVGGEPVGASLFTALQEQLGLRLEPGKGAVPVLVIDSVDRPTED